MGNHMQGFATKLARLAACLFWASCVFALGCKSSRNGTEPEEKKTDPSKRTAYSREDSNANADKRQSDQTSGSGPSAGEYSTTKTTKKESTAETDKEAGYEGGDPNIYHPPVHAAPPREKVEQRARASTPTPTPSRPIDRPLDPSGKPVFSPTP